MDDLRTTLMRRDGMTFEEATALIKEAKEDLLSQLENGEHVDEADFCSDWFGLEPDYIMDVLY